MSSVCSSSLNQYEKRFKSWTDFTSSLGISPWIDHLSDLQQATTFARFMAFLARKRLNSWATIKGKVSAVRWMHRMHKEVELVIKHPVLSLVGAGCQRTLAKSRSWEPVTVAMLRALALRFANSTLPESKILWGCLLLSFFFLERGGEVWGGTHALTMENITLWEGEFKQWDGSSKNYPRAITLKWPTDKTRTGAEITMFASGDKDLCPVKGMLIVLQGRAMLRQQNKVVTKFVASGSAKSKASSAIKWSARKCGISENLDRYVIHSMRVGGTTALAAAGEQEMIVRLLGRWKSTTVRTYTRRLRGTFAGLSGVMISENQDEAIAWGRGSTV